MSAERPTCDFLRLPYELRLRIYEDLLVVEGPITLADNKPRFTGRLDPQLLRTCRQIHEETADVLYGSNTFETLLHTNGLLVRHLNKWLRTITDTNVARLNRLKFMLLYPAYAKKGMSGHFYVETTLRLQKLPAWSYVAKHRPFGSKCWTCAPVPQFVEIELERDSKVDEQLEMRFQTKAILGAPWLSHDILFIYAALSQIRPRPKVDVEMLPDSVASFFERASQAWRE